MKTPEIVSHIAGLFDAFDAYWLTSAACEGDGSESKLIEAIRASIFSGQKVYPDYDH